MDIKILYEDEYVIALDKPAGLLVHPDGRSGDLTLVDWIRINRPELEDVGEPQTLQNGETIKRPGIVHRLDRETSGVILLAKTQESFEFLKKQFQDRTTEKIYHCLVWGGFSETSLDAHGGGAIDRPIGRSSNDFRRWSATRGAKGEKREAVTEYTVLAQNSDNVQTGFAYLEVRPKTGRTHQIRVHMQAINHPVVCDFLYAPNREEALNLKRLALHALSIKFKLPNGKIMKIESPLPQEFTAARKQIEAK